MKTTESRMMEAVSRVWNVVKLQVSAVFTYLYPSKLLSTLQSVLALLGGQVIGQQCSLGYGSVAAPASRQRLLKDTLKTINAGLQQ